ncbi:MAG TPA: hypothetical protein VMV38_02030 [Candidatus Paceibacterota bacterium]|nr:hypothetical protein [Candidatus Paceibacterota bacterium]
MNRASNGMNNQKNKETHQETERRALPFLVEFVKFATGFTIIVMLALITLHFASAATL